MTTKYKSSLNRNNLLKAAYSALIPANKIKKKNLDCNKYNKVKDKDEL